MKRRIARLTFFQKAVLWVNIAIAFFYLLSAYAGYVDPYTAGYSSLLVLGYPVMLILLVFFIPLWLIMRRPIGLAVDAVALLATLPQLATFFPIHIVDQFSERTEGDFTLMTYNTFGFDAPNDSTGNPIASEILLADADFVCLQEVPLWKTFEEKRVTASQADLLKSRYPYSAFDGKLSLGFFSARPTTTIYRYRSDPYFSVAAYRTSVGNDSAFIINTHMESIGLTQSDKRLYMRLTAVDDQKKSLLGVRSRLLNKLMKASRNRAKQARMVRHLADSLRKTAPDALMFICGDFNDTPYSYAYLKTRDDMHDAYRDGGFLPTYTYNANRFYFKIDHIFYSGDIEAVRTYRRNNKASDHYPLIATFRAAGR